MRQGSTWTPTGAVVGEVLTFPGTPAPSPERKARGCLVCGAELTRRDPESRRGYCRRHPFSEWRFISCAVPGCNNVTRRRWLGQNRYVCPVHARSPR